MHCRAFYINDVTDANDHIAAFNEKYGTNFKAELCYLRASTKIYPFLHAPHCQENRKNPPGLNIGWSKFADLESALHPQFTWVKTIAFVFINPSDIELIITILFG